MFFIRGRGKKRQKYVATTTHFATYVFDEVISCAFDSGPDKTQGELFCCRGFLKKMRRAKVSFDLLGE
jgi:hypothetical protein